MKKVAILLILLSIIVYPSISHSSSETLPIKLHIVNLIKAAEIKYELPSGLLRALIFVESSMNHKALVERDGVSGLASYGLAQIQLDAAILMQRLKAKRDGLKLHKSELIKPKDLMRPEVNVEYGAMYLKWLLQTHRNDIAWALSCYNSGPNSVGICKNKRYSHYVGLVLNALISQQTQ